MKCQLQVAATNVWPSNTVDAKGQIRSISHAKDDFGQNTVYSQSSAILVGAKIIALSIIIILTTFLVYIIS